MQIFKGAFKLRTLLFLLFVSGSQGRVITPEWVTTWTDPFIKEVDQENSSTLQGHHVTYQTDYNTGASAEAHIVHYKTGNDWARAEGKVGTVGANADAGLIKLGVGVDATVGEIGGQIGKGVFSVGGKLGLSADTGVSIGLGGAKIKVLGTGVELSPEKGYEFCIFGTCISIG